MGCFRFSISSASGSSEENSVVLEEKLKMNSKKKPQKPELSPPREEEYQECLGHAVNCILSLNDGSSLEQREIKSILKNTKCCSKDKLDTNTDKEYNFGLHKKNISFCPSVFVTETLSRSEYSRKGDFMVKGLSPETVFIINSFKRELEVHEEARKFTQFFEI